MQYFMIFDCTLLENKVTPSTTTWWIIRFGSQHPAEHSHFEPKYVFVFFIVSHDWMSKATETVLINSASMS